MPPGALVPVFSLRSRGDELVLESDADEDGLSCALHVRLFARRPKTEPWLVELCDSCRTNKRPFAIELVPDSVAVSSETGVTARIRINEQCSHQSSNGYGKPDTCFFLRINVSRLLPFPSTFSFARADLPVPTRAKSFSRSYGEIR